MLAPVLALAMMQQSSSFSKGSELYAQCKNWVAGMEKTRSLTQQEAYDAGVCYGYTDAMAGGLITMRTACPNDAKIATLIRVYLAYVDAHPKVLDFAASSGVFGALREAYPCPVK